MKHFKTLGKFLLYQNMSLKPTPETTDRLIPNKTNLFGKLQIPFFLLISLILSQSQSRFSRMVFKLIVSMPQTWLLMAGQNRMGAPPASMIPTMRSVLNIWQQTAKTQQPQEWHAKTSRLVCEILLIRQCRILACSSNQLRNSLISSSVLPFSKQVKGKKRHSPGSCRKENQLGKGGAPGSRTQRMSYFLSGLDADVRTGFPSRADMLSEERLRASLFVSSISCYPLVSVQCLYFFSRSTSTCFSAFVACIKGKVNKDHSQKISLIIILANQFMARQYQPP